MQQLVRDLFVSHSFKDKYFSTVTFNYLRQFSILAQRQSLECIFRSKQLKFYIKGIGFVTIIFSLKRIKSPTPTSFPWFVFRQQLERNSHIFSILADLPVSSYWPAPNVRTGCFFRLHITLYHMWLTINMALKSNICFGYNFPFSYKTSRRCLSAEPLHPRKRHQLLKESPRNIRPSQIRPWSW